MTTSRLAVPQPPRLDLGLVVIIATMLCSSAAFFGACSSAHASNRTAAAGVELAQHGGGNGGNLQLVGGAAGGSWHQAGGVDVLVPSRLPVSRMVIEGNSTSTVGRIVFHAGGRQQAFIDSAGFHVLGSFDVDHHTVVTHDELQRVYGTEWAAAGFGGVFGAAFGLIAFTLIQRKLIARATARWMNRQTNSAGPDGGAYRSSKPDLTRIRPPSSPPAAIPAPPVPYLDERTGKIVHVRHDRPAPTSLPSAGRIVRG
jgi:hypothetical protein